MGSASQPLSLFSSTITWFVVIADLEAALQTPEVYRDATRVRDTMADLEKTKDALALLYQHWEEAVELNG